MKKILGTGILLISLLFVSCSPKAQNTEVKTGKGTTVVANPIVKLNAVDFKQQTEGKDVQLIDIRTPGEYAQGHIKDAIIIDYYKRTFLQKMNELDKSKPIYIYCRSGSRSGNASYKLKNAGFKKIYDLKGGINSWKRNAFPLVR